MYSRGLENAKPQQQELYNNCGKFFTGKYLDVLKTHPLTCSFFSQPDFVVLVLRLQENALMPKDALLDTRLSTCFQVLMGIDFDYLGAATNAFLSSQAPSKVPPATPEVARRPDAVQAEEAKLAGNEAYSRRSFAEALSHYDRAIELCPDEVTYYTNKASVFIEIGEFQQALDTCDQAIHKGRSVYASLAKISRAYERKAHIFERLNMIDDAIEQARLALLEHYTDKVKYYLKDLERLKKKEAEEAYVDPHLSEEANLRGNIYFKAGDFPSALAEYDEAVRRSPHTAKLYANRAAALVKLMEFPRALSDVNKCLELDPTYVKAYSRKGNIHFLMKEYTKSMEAFENGLKRHPDNDECKAGFQRTLAAINTAGRPDQERLRHAMADPEIQRILEDPYIQSVLRDLGAGKAEAQVHMTDPRIRNAIAKLVAAGVVKAS